MLNELYTLERSLKRLNVVVEESHPWVKRLGRSDVVIAGIDVSGEINSIEHLGATEAVTLFKIQESNHSNFPAVNWPCPIWRVDVDSHAVEEWLACGEEDERRRVGLLRTVCEGAALSSEQDRMRSRTLEFCRELQRRFFASSAAERDFAAFPELLKRLVGVRTPVEQWLQRLTQVALDIAEGGSAGMVKAVETLLIGNFDKKVRTFTKDKVSIVFDISDVTTAGYRYRVANPRMGAYFSRILNETESAGTSGGTCALSGRHIPLQTGKMPSPRLPGIGDSVLMSMNRDTPCQRRYGRIGIDIFPLGKKTASDLNAALISLTSPERKRKNWMLIPGSTKNKVNLLIVYLESAPMLDAQVAELFSGPEESEASYGALCAEVCKALQGRAAVDSDFVHLFVLNKIDPGRVQVELSATFTAAQAIEGAAGWRRGARNRPALPMRDDELTPSPWEVLRCLQMQWERSGSSYSQAPGCRLAEIYDVLIDGRESWRASATTLLHLTMQRTSDLLIAIGHATHRNIWKGISREAGRNPVIAAALLAITLNKLGFQKETYMQQPAFLVGRFLSLADTLHAEYSKEVRKDLPPQLLGNALIPTAISDPNKGLARMLQRIRVYQAWARGKKGTGLARWSCGEMGRLANVLAEILERRPFTEPEQAQLLLGYLARTESKQGKADEEGDLT